MMTPLKNIKTPLFFLRKLMKPKQVLHMGIRLRVDCPVISDWVRDAIYKGFYERSEARLLNKNLVSEDRVLEVGGGIGFLGAICKKASYLVVYEANGALRDIIEEHFRLNNVKAQVNAVALVGEESKENVQVLYIGPHFWNASLHPVPGFQRYYVPTEKFSHALVTHSPSFLVVDVEGYEYELFNDLSIPQSVKKILIEFHPKRLDSKKILSLREFFKLQGFRPVDQEGEAFFYTRLAS